MKKRVLALILILAFVLGISALAVEQATIIEPDLIFEGTTAHCSVTVTNLNASINATVELYYGNTKLSTWSDSGTHTLYVGGEYTVVKGETYLLVARGDVDGTPFYETVVRTCP